MFIYFIHGLSKWLLEISHLPINTQIKNNAEQNINTTPTHLWEMYGLLAKWNEDKYEIEMSKVIDAASMHIYAGDYSKITRLFLGALKINANNKLLLFVNDCFMKVPI